MVRLLLSVLLALLVSALTCEASRAEECFGGVTCRTAALAVNSFEMARDCSSILKINPSKVGEYQRVMFAVRHRPMAGVWGEEYTATVRQRPIEECKRAGRAIANGKVPGTYLIVRPEVIDRLDD